MTATLYIFQGDNLFWLWLLLFLLKGSADTVLAVWLPAHTLLSLQTPDFDEQKLLIYLVRPK